MNWQSVCECTLSLSLKIIILAISIYISGFLVKVDIFSGLAQTIKQIGLILLVWKAFITIWTDHSIIYQYVCCRQWEEKKTFVWLTSAGLGKCFKQGYVLLYNV